MPPGVMVGANRSCAISCAARAHSTHSESLAHSLEPECALDSLACSHFLSPNRRPLRRKMLWDIIVDRRAKPGESGGSYVTQTVRVLRGGPRRLRTSERAYPYMEGEMRSRPSAYAVPVLAGLFVLGTIPPSTAVPSMNPIAKTAAEGVVVTRRAAYRKRTQQPSYMQEG